MTRQKELDNATRKTIIVDGPTLEVLNSIHFNTSKAVRILASWHKYSADRDERTRTAPQPEPTGR